MRVSDERLADLLERDSYRMYQSVLPMELSSMLAELQSLRSKPVAGVEVKPLEWHGPDVNDEIYARSALCVYTIQKQRKSMGFWLTEVGGNYASIDEAKAAAAADYRQRILSALLPKATAPVVSEPVAYLVKDKFAPSISPTVLLASSSVLPSVRLDTERFDLSPLYASPQPKAVITDEMVERACSSLFPKWVDRASWTQARMKADCRAALTAALKED